MKITPARVFITLNSEGSSCLTPVGAAKNITELKQGEALGKDNGAKVMRYLQWKTSTDETMTDRGRSRDNLAGLKASSRA